MSTRIKAKYWISGLSLLAVTAQVGPGFSQEAMQSSTSRAALRPAVISSFVTEFGTPIILGEKTLNAPPADFASISPRLTRLSALTSGAGLTWRKLYRITPATANAPVTTLNQAREMVDQDSQITLSVDSAPIDDIDRLISRGDNAVAIFPDGAPKTTVSLAIGDTNVSDAIAAIAAATHTHWLAAYYVAPAAAVVAPQATTIIAYEPPLTQQEYEERYLFNGPFTLHAASPAPVATVIAAAPGGTNPANQPAPIQMTPQASVAQQENEEEMLPAVVNDPYGYSGLMYAPGYAYGGTQVINPFQ